MKVYILQSGVDFEGSEIEGVYDSIEKAKNAEEIDIVVTSWQEKILPGKASYWLAMNKERFSFPQWWTITECEVK